MITGSGFLRHLDSMNSIASLQKQISALNIGTALQEQTNVLNLGTAFQEQTSLLNLGAALQEQTSLLNLGAAFQEQTSLLNLGAAFQEQTSLLNLGAALQEQTSVLNLGAALQEQISTINIGRAAQLAMSAFNKNQLFHNSITALAQPGFFETAINALNEHTLDLESFEYESYESQVIEDGLEGISSSNCTKSFNDYFKKLPAYLQLIIVYIFMQIVTPQINSISANLITPHVECFLSSSQSEDRIKIKEIKNIAKKTTVETSGLRFITGNNVRLRSGPSTNSNILDELEFGQIVTVLSKKKNWIEVQYNDNDVFCGWVFTRYTSRFKK